MSRVVKSWDVFDTLLARRCFEPHGVFDKMGEILRVPSFRQLRQQSEAASDFTFSGIYKELQTRAGLSDEVRAQTAQLELHIERQEGYLIPETCQQVEDGDILVSDMYLDGATILSLLRHAGFAPKVRVFASPHGKHFRKIWGHIEAQGLRIAQHTGDNFTSDVISPTACGIVGRFYEGSRLTPLEQAAFSQGFDSLARLMRTTRLMNPYLPGSIDHRMWNEQAQLNGPLLYLASLHLGYLHAERQPQDTLLFVTRDGCHWHKLHRVLFPQASVHYLDASRALFYHPTEAYLNHIRRFGDPSRLVLVDVYGSGRSPYAFFTQHFGTLPFCYMLATGLGEHVIYPQLQSTGRASALVAAGNACFLEALNYDTVGMLEDFTADGPVRAAPGYDIRLLEPYHRAIACFIREAAHGVHRRPDEKALVSLMQRLLDETQRGVDILRLVEGDWLWSAQDVLKRRRPQTAAPALAAAIAEPSQGVAVPQGQVGVQ
jgi:hypothetical protein